MILLKTRTTIETTTALQTLYTWYLAYFSTNLETCADRLVAFIKLHICVPSVNFLSHKKRRISSRENNIRTRICLHRDHYPFPISDWLDFVATHQWTAVSWASPDSA
ncbi:hypothetical protein M5D96_013012 [Drosophila gunungcola]|uniref:Uncharacterized protein n=1 Tax=Drosophila gunungcola TaxID=103775 RepID=A0A9Q0BJH0_9MUSC|nr:hypothetical protein M5D96_013012 [Drosophila gunungcola]